MSNDGVDIKNNVVKIKVKDLNHFLTCTECNGYYRDAHTIPECLHTFCKICIIKHFQHSAETRVKGTTITCPKCETEMGGTLPQAMQKIIYDRNIQEIVDKLFPHFIEQEKEEERQFYINEKQGEEEEAKQDDLQLQQAIEASKLTQQQKPAQPTPINTKPETDAIVNVNENENATTTATTTATTNAAKKPKIEVHVLIKLFPFDNDSMETESETSASPSHQPLPALKKPTLKATLNVRVNKLQKFIHKRFDEELQNKIAMDAIEILHKTTVLDPRGDLLVLQNDMTTGGDQGNIFLHYRRKTT